MLRYRLNTRNCNS